MVGAEETYDDGHHKFKGAAGPYAPCELCGLVDESEVHTSFEQFSRDVDQTFGK